MSPRSARDVSPSAPNRPVLLVEDEADTRELMATLLEYEGLIVVPAVDGLEALDLLQGGLTPCVIVTDLMMPRMSGWELARKLRALPDFAGTPLVLVSGVADLARRAQELDAEAFLTKPIDLDALLLAVRRWCAAP